MRLPQGHTLPDPTDEIASAKPTLLYLQSSDLGKGILIALDGSGKERWRVSNTSADWKFRATISLGLTTSIYEVSGNTLVLGVELSDDHVLMGFDLATGRRLWRTEKTSGQRIVTTPGKSVVAWRSQQGFFGFGYEAVRVSPGDGSTEVRYASNDKRTNQGGNLAYAVNGWFYYVRSSKVYENVPILFAVHPE